MTEPTLIRDPLGNPPRFDYAPYCATCDAGSGRDSRREGWKCSECGAKRWHWFAGVEVEWTRWGLGGEVSFGHWWPMEISGYVHVGPLLLGAGVEENMEWRYPMFDPKEAENKRAALSERVPPVEGQP